MTSVEDIRNEVTLSIDKELFVCSKPDLISRSEYFRAMFSHEFTEKNKDLIIIRDVNPVAFKFILERQPLETPISVDLITDVLRVSSMLQFDDETEKYENFILNNCLYSKPIKVMTASFELDRVKLYHRSLAYCLWNFSDLINDEDFIDIPLNLLITFIDNEGLNTAKGEIEVFTAVEKWIEKNLTEDNDVFKIMESLRYCSFTENNLEEILTSRTISRIENMKALLQNLITFKKSKQWLGCDKCSTVPDPDYKGDIEYPRYCTRCMELHESVIKLFNRPPRVSRAIPCFIMHNFTHIESDQMCPVIFGYDYEKIIKIMTLTKKPFSEIFIGFKIISIGFKLYVFGGEHGYGKGMFNMAVWSYDFITEKWSYECQLSQQRRHFATAVLDDWVFLLGGTGRYRKVLKTIEKFDMKTKKWSTCTKLPHSNSFVPAVCSFGKKLYILDGYGTLYTYDPFNNLFNTVPIDLENIAALNFICIYYDYLYAVETTTARIYRWQIFNNSNHKYRAESLGQFSCSGESITVGDCIYHFSYEISQSMFCVERLTFKSLIIEQLFSYPYKCNVGDLQFLFNGSFIYPNYF